LLESRKRQQYNSVGEHAEFDHAKREAEEWLTQIAGTSMRSVKRASVNELGAAYDRSWPFSEPILGPEAAVQRDESATAGTR
jgi:hypothetical protein